ncbi:MAG: hypothetical protein LC792_17245, partial [Actinobacteria bacterium]|nr:hypothetical protein [Actinomycetota bacterium]
ALGSDGAVVQRLDRALEELVDRGALISDLHLCRLAPDAWTALRAMTPSLIEPHQQPWADAIRAVRRHCEGLTRCLVQDDPDGVRAARDAVAVEVAKLGRAVRVDVPPLEEVVRVDVRLGFDVTWDHATQEAVGVAVAHGLAFYGSDGAAEQFRQASLADIAATRGSGTSSASIGALLGAGLAATGRPPAPCALADSVEGAFWAYRSIDGVPTTVARVIEHWHRRLDGSWPAASYRWEDAPAEGPAPRVAAGPAGALLLTLCGPVSFRIEWGRPQPGIFALRQAETLRGSDGETPVVDALRDLFDRWRQRGVTPVEVVGADSPSLNTALGPRLTPMVLDVHGDPGCGELLLDVDAGGRPWLRPARSDDVMVPVYNSASFIGLSDPCSRLLLRLAMGHGWELLSGGFLTLPAERRSSHHLPRIVLPDTTVVAGERWTIASPTLAELRHAGPSQQYLLWRAVADRLRLPDLVWARLEPAPTAPGLLFRTDSPLAVQCLFGRLRPHIERLVLTEPPGDPARWPLKDGEGRTYLAELAVTWYDDRYWDAVLGLGGAEGP